VDKLDNEEYKYLHRELQHIKSKLDNGTNSVLSNAKLLALQEKLNKRYEELGRATGLTNSINTMWSAREDMITRHLAGRIPESNLHTTRGARPDMRSMLARLRPDAPFDRTEGFFFKDDPRIADLTAQLAVAKSTIESLNRQITSLKHDNKVYAEALDKLRKEKETSRVDEQQQTLAQNLESSYNSMHTFWTEKSQNYSKKGILPLLLQMQKVDDLMTKLMPLLRQGKIRNRIPIEQIQKDVNEISTIQSVHQYGYHDFDFSNYMKSVRDVSSILYDYLHPQTL
jgi:uncharacterized coiled-coil protein SlyX